MESKIEQIKNVADDIRFQKGWEEAETVEDKLNFIKWYLFQFFDRSYDRQSILMIYTLATDLSNCKNFAEEKQILKDFGINRFEMVPK